MPVYKSNVPTKDGRSYFFRIKYKNILGKNVDYTSKKYKSKSDAEMAEAFFRINLKDKTETNNITISEAYYDLLTNKKNKVKEQTLNKIQNQYKYIEPLGKYKINDFNINIYRAWLKWFDNKSLCVINKNKILGLLRQIISHSAKFYDTSDKMVKYIENYSNLSLKREMEFFTYNEYLLFENAINDSEEWKLFFQMLYYLGLRQGELTALTWNDIDFKNKTININKSLTTKLKGKDYVISKPKTNNSIRQLPLSDKLIDGLKKHYNHQTKYTNYNSNWFVFGNTIPFKETTIQNRKNRYCDEAKLKRIRIHDFRHSCASLLINQGASITLVSKWLGHSKISMTLNTYTHLYKSELNDITKLINNL